MESEEKRNSWVWKRMMEPFKFIIANTYFRAELDQIKGADIPPKGKNRGLGLFTLKKRCPINPSVVKKRL